MVLLRKHQITKNEIELDKHTSLVHDLVTNEWCRMASLIRGIHRIPTRSKLILTDREIENNTGRMTIGKVVLG